MQTVHIHIGPHAAGEHAITRALDSSRDDLRERLSLSVLPPIPVAEAALRFNTGKAPEGQRRLRRLAKELRETPSLDGVISCPDLAGPLPGLSKDFSPYPDLAQRLEQVAAAFPDQQCRFYFLCPPEELWLADLRGVLATRTDREIRGVAGDARLDFSRGWTAVLPPAGLEAINGNDALVAAGRFLDRLDPTGALQRRMPLGRAADAGIGGVLAAIVEAPASPAAKEAARTRLLLPPDTAGPPPQTAASYPDWPPRAPVLPVPKALAALGQRAAKRVSRQGKIDNVLPEPDIALAALRTDLVDGAEEFPGGKRANMLNQIEILSPRLRHRPAATLLNALTISYLRRDTPYTSEARHLFLRLWREEHEILLGTLPARWLISTLQTFFDHGETEDQRMIGGTGFFFSNLLKAYEGERAIEGHAPDALYSGTKPTTKTGFPGMDRFRLGNTDLMLNTMAMLLETAGREPVAGRVLTEYILRLKTADTLFSRMDRSRRHLGADMPGFKDCWSFHEPPDGTD